MERIGHYINNKIVINEKNRSAPVYNPASGKQIAEVELGDESEVEIAVSAAADARSTATRPPRLRVPPACEFLWLEFDLNCTIVMSLSLIHI